MKEEDVFETRTALQAAPERVLDTARQALLGQGAHVKQVSDRELHVVCEWSHMGRSPLVGVTEATLRIVGSDLHLHATLGGIAKVRRFALLLPLGIGGTLTTIFALIWWTPGTSRRRVGASGAARGRRSLARDRPAHGPRAGTHDSQGAHEPGGVAGLDELIGPEDRARRGRSTRRSLANARERLIARYSSHAMDSPSPVPNSSTRASTSMWSR